MNFDLPEDLDQKHSRQDLTLGHGYTVQFYPDLKAGKLALDAHISAGVLALILRDADTEEWVIVSEKLLNH
jgi:hypothetical protein